jgi:drug/metabolite transporter (DMT)-like permease
MPLSDNLRGSLFMTASMAGFAIEDMFLKGASRGMPVGQAVALMGLVGVAVFALAARAQGEPPLPRAMWSGTMAMRSVFEVAGRLFYALALALTPISQASAILQAAPIIVVLGAAVLFGERVGAWRWALIVLGFLGVLIILRPGAEGFSPLSLLAFIAMLGFAGRDLATRAAPPALSNAQLGVLGFLMFTLSGLVILAVTGGVRLPDGPSLALLVGSMVSGILAYAALTQAMRLGEVGVVTPFRYTRLLFALAIGFLAFGEVPDTPMLAGSALIVACGVALLARRQRN